MAGPKYPLDSLQKLRARRVDDAMAGLAAAVQARESAERERAAADGRRAAHMVAAERVRGAERAALESGRLRAADLAQGQAWHDAVESEAARLLAAAAESAAGEQRRRDAEASARIDVAARKADAEAVARDRARWEAARQKHAEAQDEEASLEAWRPGR